MLDFTTYHFDEFLNDFESLYQKAITLNVTDELIRQARIIAQATERQLEVEVRRVYTNLQYELLKGQSTKARNAVYGLYYSTTSVQDVLMGRGKDWFEFANEILLNNEVANALGYPDISTLDDLSDAFRSATRAARIVEAMNSER